MPIPVSCQVFIPGNPAVAFTHEPDKKRGKVPAAVNLLEADLDGGAVFGFLFCYTPAQVDLGKAHLPCPARRPHAGKIVLIRWARSASMSRKVEERNTRISRDWGWDMGGGPFDVLGLRLESARRARQDMTRSI